jgi:glyoxylase-like metal-dependent hydrolase (beta-lactamase superfamily II)/rhodanese-related sulfurtransferase
MDVTLSPSEFKKRLDAGEVPFIFDLRNSDEFKGWRVEGRSAIETLNIPQEEFVGEEDRYLDRFPKDRPIVTFCAHGDAAVYAAELLRGAGRSAWALDGGMDRWSEYYEDHPAAASPAVQQVYRVAKGCIAHVVCSGGSAIAIDAPRHTRVLLDLAERLKVRFVHVLDTHLHADHISGGRELARQTGAAYHVHPLDVQGAAYPFTPLADGGRILFGTSTVDVVHSPGHTPGSTSFLVDGKLLFTGDIIMKESIGRPDLGGMADPWAADLYTTLFERYGRLNDDTMVLPSHATGIAEQDGDGVVRLTLGQARRGIDLFRLKDKAEFIARIRASLLENPVRYQDIRKVNLAVLAADEARLKELEIGKNLCGMKKH